MPPSPACREDCSRQSCSRAGVIARPIVVYTFPRFEKMVQVDEKYGGCHKGQLTLVGEQQVRMSVCGWAGGQQGLHCGSTLTGRVLEELESLPSRFETRSAQ